MHLLWQEGSRHCFLSGSPKSPGPSVTVGLLTGHINSCPPLPRFTLQAKINTLAASHSVLALIDSGAEQNLMDGALAQQWGIPSTALPTPLQVSALDGTQLSVITHKTQPLSVTLSGNHTEQLSFFLFDSPQTPLVLGFPWLQLHNPHINWATRSISGWSEWCHQHCLGSATPSTPRITVSREGTPPDLSSVPQAYHDLAEVFSKDRAVSLPPHRPYDCAITLVPGASYPSSRLYSLSQHERDAMEKYITEAQAAGLIRSSTSPLGAGFFFVSKKDGTLRPCIDYRGLNEITVRNRYPLPLLTSAFELLQGATIFSRLNLRNAYHLVRVRKGDEWKTAFNTHLGHFEYLVMPFGLTNAPAVFQALVNDVLRDFINHFVFVYLDDILIFSSSLQEHQIHVRQVLQRLLENRLFVKGEKCEFHVETTAFLGYIITKGQIKADPVKVQAVLEWPEPTDRKQLQRFLGFANFYRRFIKDYSSITHALTSLTSPKLPFRWTPAASDAFSFLKNRFTAAPILIQPDLSKPFVVEVDASDVGVGAVLSQRSAGSLQPCAFFSRRLSPAERTYDVGDRELLAIKLALEEWRHWLEGATHPFLVWTDHKK